MSGGEFVLVQVRRGKDDIPAPDVDAGGGQSVLTDGAVTVRNDGLEVFPRGVLIELGRGGRGRVSAAAGEEWRGAQEAREERSG